MGRDPLAARLTAPATRGRDRKCRSSARISHPSAIPHGHEILSVVDTASRPRYPCPTPRCTRLLFHIRVHGNNLARARTTRYRLCSISRLTVRWHRRNASWVSNRAKKKGRQTHPACRSKAPRECAGPVCLRASTLRPNVHACLRRRDSVL